MDVIKTETNSDGDEDPVSHQKETLPLAVRVSEVKSDVSTSSDTGYNTVGHEIQPCTVGRLRPVTG
jgi:hypothetical protein